MKPLSHILYRMVTGEKPPVKNRLNDILKLAKMNRVYLHVLKTLGLNDPPEEKRLARAVKLTEEVTNTLKGLEYTTYKLVKPVLYTPADVDLLVHPKHFKEARRRLVEKGFKTAAIDPYSITLVRKRDVVDLYLHPSTGWLKYMDGPKLLEQTTTGEFHGVETPMLEKPAEAAVTAAHAAVKEWILLLNDLITVEKWLTRKTLDTAEEHGVTPALCYTLAILDRLKKGQAETPHRIPPPRILTLLAGKTLGNKVWRLGITRTAAGLRNPRYRELLIDKLKRTHY